MKVPVCSDGCGPLNKEYDGGDYATFVCPNGHFWAGEMAEMVPLADVLNALRNPGDATWGGADVDRAADSIEQAFGGES